MFSIDSNVLPWLIPLPPLLAFVLITLVVGRNRFASHVVAIGGMALSWLMSWSLVAHAIGIKTLGLPGTEPGYGVFGHKIDWLVNGSGKEGSGALSMGVMVDPLTVVMLFMVPFVCLMIFIYSRGYMAHDKRNTRFFAFLGLFAGAMLTLVVADNLLLLFVGWEVMGLCSYLLIGFWYEKAPEEEFDGVSPYQAAIKAFLTTRVADVIMVLGIAYLWASTGTLNFHDIMHSEPTLKALATVNPNFNILGLSAAAVIGICIVAGTIGKSAQFPLHVWLPDAMKGPTPVSAMIHAAAMVSAGVYLVIRMFPILSAGANIEEGLFTAPMVLMAVVGSFTALFAATIAIAQNDIKKVLAYSTVSQLGFMVAALGIGAYVAAAFHLITHAFFKGLLFMGSGSVIHGMEHGHHVAHGGHDEHTSEAHGEEESHGAHAEHKSGEHKTLAPPDFDPQDMRNMGGLLRNMPVTGWTFIIGGMSLAGLPLVTAGFWSKDEILAEAFHASSRTPLGILVLVLLSLAAILTAIYTLRQIAMTFFGDPRTEAAEHAQHYNPARGDGIVERNISIAMTGPLIALAFFAIFAGYVGVNSNFPVFGSIMQGLNLDQAFPNWVSRSLLEPPPHPEFSLVPVLISFTIFGLGAYAGYLLYFRRPIALGQPDAVEGIIGPDIYRVLQNKYYLDEFYGRYFIRPFRWIAEKFTLVYLDKGLIDGTLHFIAQAAGRIGDLFREFNRVVIDGVGDGIPEAIADAARGLRPVQTGKVQQYLLYALIASLVVGGNLVLLTFFPEAVLIAALVQGLIAVFLIVLTGSGGAPASSDSTGSGD
jgi:NADH-quinone oxidoreductase subunit L